MRFYSGDIREYQLDTDGMCIQEKINRLKEMESLEEKAKKRLSKRFLWLLLPILYGIFHFVLMLINVATFSGPFIIRCLFTFVVVCIMSLVFIPIILPEKLEKKNVWKKWLSIFVISVGYTLYSPSVYVWAYSLLVAVLALFVIAIVYILLSKRGFSEIIDYSKGEQGRLYNEIALEIDKKPLRPIELNYDVVLGKGEIPLMESDAILLEVRERQNSPTGASAAHYLSTYTNALFRNIDLLNNSVTENIYNIKENIKKVSSNVAQNNVMYRNTALNYGNAQNSNNSSSKNEFIGKFILTQKRIMFVGCPRGFQIFNKNLIAYGIDPKHPRNITFQSEKSIRVLSIDDSVWIKRYLDRIMMEEHMNRL